MWWLAKLIAVITGIPRDKTEEIKWYPDNYFGNVFRAWEWLAWRRRGIRCEMSAHLVDGEFIHYAHTWESAFVLAEKAVRDAFRLPYMPRIYVPILTTPVGIPVPALPYLFAIAFDTAAESTASTSPNSENFTPGSVTNNLITLSVNVPNGATSVASTYNSVTATQIGSGTGSIGGTNNYAFFVVGTASGTHSASCSWSGGGNGMIGAGNYTGVKQTSSVPDHADVTGAIANTWAPNLTTTVDNSWVVLDFTNSSGATTAGSNTAARLGNVNAEIFDSNAVISPPANRTLNVNSSSSTGNYAGEIFSIAPFISAGAATPHLLTSTGVGS